MFFVKISNRITFIKEVLRALLRFNNAEAKTIYFALDGNPYTRHFYCLCLFLREKDVNVLIKPSKAFLIDSYRDIYARRLFKLENVKFIFFNIPSYALKLTKVSPDYYKNNGTQTNYHVPLSMHPIYYQERFQNFDPKKVRQNIVFFAGNLDFQEYNNSALRDLFNVVNRCELVDRISPDIKVQFLTKKNFNLSFDRKVLIVDKQDFSLDFEEYLHTLHSVTFFLACPGIVKPTAHNLIEAIFSEAIPIIQKEYAEIMKPPLEDGINAIFFHTLEDLNETISRAFALEAEDLELMRKNLKAYYHNYLSPSAVVDNILEGKFKTIFLEAEYESVRLLKEEINQGYNEEMD